MMLRLLWLGLIFHPSLGLVCKICRHKGLSMVPPSAPRSRFVFNAPQAACVEDEVTCAPHEEFCLSAYGYHVLKSPEPGTNWVQKGCVGGASSRQGLRPATKGQGCTEQVLDLSAARSLPLPNPDTPLTLTVCVCNSGDNCNAGILHLRDDPSTATAALPTLLMILVHGLLLLR